MQYGAELLTYKRTKRVEEEKKVINYTWQVKYIIYFIISILISRVLLINKTAPFGIAFLIPMVINKEDKLPIVVSSGALIGYVTLFSSINDLPLYISIIASLMLLSYAINGVSKRNKLIIVFSVLLVVHMIYNLIFKNFTLGVNVLFSVFDVACVFPLYFIMDYAILCSKEFKTKHLFSNEEIISMAIVLSLVISGTWGITLFGISLRNIFALFFVISISYINGSATGASAGVAVGTIVGMSSNNIIAFIGIYGLSGLIVGLFKETGKVLSVLSYLVSFSIIKLYSNVGGDFKIIEAIITSVAMISIPQKIYDSISLELDWEKKNEKINENHMEKIKDIFVGRLEGFSGVLYNMSMIVNTLIDNDKLLMKGKSSALIENLADRVCANCDMNFICWKREIHYTYSAFSELISSYQENRPKVPDELERKCVKRTALLKNTEDIVNNHIINEMWRNRLTEGRQILSGQINNMALSVKEIVEEFNAKVKVNTEIERSLRKLLNKNEVKFKDIFCYEDKKGRINIRLTMNQCGGNQICVKEILPYINSVCGVSMSISDEGCSIDPVSKQCNVIYEETPKYHVASYVGRECKNGEKYNGDSYSFGKLKDGTYMVVLSDGMGSGPEAGKESRAAVELIECFSEAGFSKVTSINTINSIMTLKFSEDEKFSTLDLSSIDLYTGETDFMKIGAVASYIKRGENVEVIKSSSLPIGVLDKVDVEVENRILKNGDIIVMLTDGILECDDEAGKRDWLLEYLRSITENNPKDIAEEIIKFAKELSNGRPKDDMTVVVSKVYSLY